MEIVRYTVNLGPWPVIAQAIPDNRLATVASVIKGAVPGTIIETEGYWVYQTDDFAEADAICIFTRGTISQYFPEGGYLSELLRDAVFITELDLEEELDQ